MSCHNTAIQGPQFLCVAQSHYIRLTCLYWGCASHSGAWCLRNDWVTFPLGAVLLVRFCQRDRTGEMWHPAVWHKFTDNLEGPTASIFRIVNKVKQATSKKLAASSGLFFNPENGCSRYLWNVSEPHYRAPYSGYYKEKLCVYYGGTMVGLWCSDKIMVGWKMQMLRIPSLNYSILTWPWTSLFSFCCPVLCAYHLHVNLEACNELLHALEASLLQLWVRLLQSFVQHWEYLLSTRLDVVACCQGSKCRLAQRDEIAYWLIAWQLVKDRVLCFTQG